MSKKKPDLLVDVKECSHVNYKITGSGMNMITLQRDIDIKCEDCGTAWNIRLQHGKKRAYIKVVG